MNTLASDYINTDHRETVKLKASPFKMSKNNYRPH